MSVCLSVRSLFSETGHRTTMKFGGNIENGDLMVHVKSNSKLWSNVKVALNWLNVRVHNPNHFWNIFPKSHSKEM